MIPKTLPRFAESFRVLIDHPDWKDTRLLDGDWQDSMTWGRTTIDFGPLLAKAGRLKFIASTLPVGVVGRGRAGVDRYYGVKDFPDLTWWSNEDGTWEPFYTEPRHLAFAACCGIAPEMLNRPRDE